MNVIGQALLMIANRDPYWSYVKTLLHFDGGVTDSSTAALAYSLAGNAVISATAPLFGSGILDCTNVVGVNGVVSPGSGALALGTSDFCIEGWFKDTGVGGANKYVFISVGSVNNIHVWIIGGQMTVDAGGPVPSPVNFAPPLGGIWHHIAVTRNGNLGVLWLNGVSTQTWDSTGMNYGAGINTIYIGRSSGGGDYRLLMDDWRVTIGVPRYTAAFTPSGPFPAF